jgi:hypothetical protein
MKPLLLGYQKIDMCPNFYMLYYLKNTDLIEYRTYGHTWYKSRTKKEMTFIAYRKLRYLPITPRLQKVFMFLKTSEQMT